MRRRGEPPGPPSVLLGGSVVAGASVHLERGQASRRRQLDLDASPASVADQVRRLVADDVLVAQFDGDLLHNVRQLVGVLNAEHLTSRDLRKLSEQAVPEILKL